MKKQTRKIVANTVLGATLLTGVTLGGSGLGDIHTAEQQEQNIEQKVNKIISRERNVARALAENGAESAYFLAQDLGIAKERNDADDLNKKGKKKALGGAALLAVSAIGAGVRKDFIMDQDERQEEQTAKLEKKIQSAEREA